MSNPKTLKLLITVKSYPVPSRKYGELACIAGVTEEGDFIRLYPVPFRSLPYDKQFKKYQWIEIQAERNPKDSRRESWRPTMGKEYQIGKQIGTDKGTWRRRADIVLKKKSRSMEELKQFHNENKTSLGIICPAQVTKMVIKEVAPNWDAKRLAMLKQQKLFEDNSGTLIRKLPYKFSYHFKCDDRSCKGHKMSIHDWELGALFWNEVKRLGSNEKAAESVKLKYFAEICGRDKDTYFYVGTVARHQTWIVLGTFYPKRQHNRELSFDG